MPSDNQWLTLLYSVMTVFDYFAGVVLGIGAFVFAVIVVIAFRVHLVSDGLPMDSYNLALFA